MPFFEYIVATVGTEVIVGAQSKNNLNQHRCWVTSDHIIATTTLDTILAFVTPFE
jgi:hypothetical protein